MRRGVACVPAYELSHMNEKYKVLDEEKLNNVSRYRLHRAQCPVITAKGEGGGKGMSLLRGGGRTGRHHNPQWHRMRRPVRDKKESPSTQVHGSALKITSSPVPLPFGPRAIAVISLSYGVCSPPAWRRVLILLQGQAPPQTKQSTRARRT